MGGRQHTRNGSRRRPARRAAAFLLLFAFGVVAAAAFLCPRPAEAHPVRAGAWAGADAAHAACVSPYDLPGCSGLSHVTPAVLPAPPPAVSAAGAAGPPAPVRRASGGPVRPPGTLARAPDLHALQVLRT
ncbi:hypothetical protein OOK31_24150 [Streptomyces sp. NBC_00249]|uniref:hypothetical protein n=1 Tax=Streptomyces sp. NBC_00249 TaxID=2975690 RepID=UPI00225522BB|nr:hypothetical protein [Streptomyces sp. NBC_00249]MCX5196949.1 hypothetical protein [Streptomyces sp. NBC_00249]